MSRSMPNIIITGTPGVGKTSLCESLASSTNLQHLSINRVVKERNCYEGWDEDSQSWIVDEDKHCREQQLLDAIEDDVRAGGYLLDWHACDLFPDSWIDLVIVLRSESNNLYDRLKARKYSEKKLQENMDAEIMEVLLAEARDAFDKDVIVELQSNNPDDIESNVGRIGAWIAQWTLQNGGATAEDGDGAWEARASKR
ncbi:MAG: hypothetical protein Q9193_002279 [Seirophora villosa]